MSTAMAWYPGAYTGTRMDTSENLTRARQGHDEEFRSIFEHHHRFIMRFLYGMVGERDMAEELTQETFLRAYRNWNTLRNESKVSTWLCGIAKNVALNYIRSHRREVYPAGKSEAPIEEITDDKPQPDLKLLNAELKQVIYRALGQLDEDKRMVFTLKVLQHQSYEEIADVTGFSIPKLKTDLHRAKAEMRRMIVPYLEAYDSM